MTTYRVFIGFWDDGAPEWTHLDTTGLPWERARELMMGRLKRFEGDDCEVCRDQAAAEAKRLMGLEPGSFEAEVDGEDYLILPER